jgi:hypothetical protein
VPKRGFPQGLKVQLRLSKGTTSQLGEAGGMPDPGRNFRVAHHSLREPSMMQSPTAQVPEQG